jgi:hypothetical protein
LPVGQIEITAADSVVDPEAKDSFIKVDLAGKVLKITFCFYFYRYKRIEIWLPDNYLEFTKKVRPLIPNHQR